MRKIYLVLTYTGTLLSKVIKIYTRKDFSHVSIALDKNLEEMYSFGRRNPYIPFIGGLVQESPDYGTFKRFRKTKTKIYSLEIEDEQYEELKNLIHTMYLDRENYRFNVIGLFAVAFHLKIRREKYFYCAEFVKYVLDHSNLEMELPELIKPDDFQNILGSQEIYSGMLQEYKL